MSIVNPKLEPQLRQQLENLRLNGDVERGGLVRPQSAAVDGSRSPIAIMTRCRMPPESW